MRYASLVSCTNSLLQFYSTFDEYFKLQPIFDLLRFDYYYALDFVVVVVLFFLFLFLLFLSCGLIMFVDQIVFIRYEKLRIDFIEKFRTHSNTFHANENQKSMNSTTTDNFNTVVGKCLAEKTFYISETRALLEKMPPLPKRGASNSLKSAYNVFTLFTAVSMGKTR